MSVVRGFKVSHRVGVVVKNLRLTYRKRQQQLVAVTYTKHTTAGQQPRLGEVSEKDSG